jgi:hypothetical protein
MARSTRGFADKKKPCNLCPEEAEKSGKSLTGTKLKIPSAGSNCKHHSEMAPNAEELKKFKNFELKSDCSTFYLASEGHNRA